MKKKIIWASVIGLVGSMSIAIGSYAAVKTILIVNGKTSNADFKIINGTTYVPLRVAADLFGAQLTYSPGVITLNTNNSSSGESSSSSLPTQTASTKTVIGASDLPYTIKAKNGMALTINSYSASTNGVSINVTVTNNSQTSDKGDLMTSTWEIYDGKNTLKFVDQDRLFWDTNNIYSGQSVTGTLKFDGLSSSSVSTFSLNGGLWQYIDKEDFKITFSV